MRGSIPATVINIVASSQPMILATIKKILDSQNKDKDGNISNLNNSPTFKGLNYLKVFMYNYIYC